MADRFPGYDVLAKRDTPSWNEQTRRVVDARLATAEPAGVLAAQQRRTLAALIDRIVPQPVGRPPVNALVLVMEKIAADASDGFRLADQPRTRDAWLRGLDAIEAEAERRHGRGFADLDSAQMDALIAALLAGEAVGEPWGGLDAEAFMRWRALPDIVAAYFSHPSAWSAMGFGGPASPRGYVRLDANRRDGWEAAEAGDGRLVPARWRNRHV